MASVLDLHIKCSKEEQRYMMVTVVANVFKNMFPTETNITSYTDQIEKRVSKIVYLDSKNLLVKNLDANLNACNLDKNKSLSLLSSPQINITGFYSNTVESITVTSIFNISKPKYVFNRTFYLQSNRELDFDL